MVTEEEVVNLRQPGTGDLRIVRPAFLQRAHLHHFHVSCLAEQIGQ